MAFVTNIRYGPYIHTIYGGGVGRYFTIYSILGILNGNESMVGLYT